MQISFQAGYGDPSRNIVKKFADYSSIDTVRDNLNNVITNLRTTKSALEQRKASLIQQHQSVHGANHAELKQKITNIETQISKIKEDIEEKRSSLSNLYYGYHERL